MAATSTYDFIIAGTGCAGLSLAMHMIQSGSFSNKKILLIDQAEKNKNDRTWSFWETKPGMFEPIVYKRWNKTWFHNEQFSRLLDLSPYQYKMIRGIDFYNYCIESISKNSNFSFVHGKVYAIGNEGDQAYVELENEKLYADYVFSSLLFEPPQLTAKEYYLQQHFKGWIIETTEPAFDPSHATFMDFRTAQDEGATFVYVKPLSETKALVEYTLFTKKLLSPEGYEKGLKEYIERFITKGAYKILEEENGVIPMTNHRFPVQDGRIIYLGTAGGQTKASSGYTFQFIQKHVGQLVKSLSDNGHPYSIHRARKRFRFYDSVLLYILNENKVPGALIFSRLFKKNSPAKVLRFLDNESTVLEELGIISSLPTIPFLKAALKQL